MLGTDQVLLLKEKFLTGGYVEGSNGEHYFYTVPGVWPLQRSALYEMIAALPKVTLDGPTVCPIPASFPAASWVSLKVLQYETVGNPLSCHCPGVVLLFVCCVHNDSARSECSDVQGRTWWIQVELVDRGSVTERVFPLQRFPSA